MANTVAQLDVVLRAELAQFKADMGKAVQTSQQEMRKMAQSMKEESEKAKQTMELLGKNIGMEIPESIRKVVASSKTLAPALNAAFSAVAIFTMINLIANELWPLLQKLSAWWRDDKAKAVAAGEAKLREELGKSMSQIELNTNKEIELIGKVGSAKIEVEKKYAEIQRDVAKQHRDALQAQYNEYKELERKLDSGEGLHQRTDVRSLSRGAMPTYQGAEVAQWLNRQKEILKDYNGDINALGKAANEAAIEVKKADAAVVIYDKNLQFTRSEEGKKRLEDFSAKAKKTADEMKKANEAFSDFVEKMRYDQLDDVGKVLQDAANNHKKVEELADAAGKSWVARFDAHLEVERRKIVELDKLIEEAKKKADEAVADLNKSNRQQIDDVLNIPTSGAPKGPKNADEWKRQQDRLKGIQKELEKFKPIVSVLDQAFEGLFMDMIVNSKSAGEAFKSFARSLIIAVTEMIAKMIVMWLIMKMIGFATGNADLKNASLGDAWKVTTGAGLPTKKDTGGNMLPGNPYRIGVPEVVIPQGAGVAIPLSQLKSGNGATYFIDASGAQDPMAVEMAVARAMKKALPMAVQASLTAQNERSYRR